MPYIGKSPSAVGVRNRFYFTASGGETSLSGSDDNGKTLVFSDASYVDVILNGGNLVSGTDYTATPSTNTISGLTALVANDIVEIIAYDVFSVSDTVSAASGGTFQSNVNFDSGIDVTGNVTVTGTVDGRDVATDGTKLDGIEASADVTDATNVAAAGALMATGGSVTGDVSFGDDDQAIFGAGSDLIIKSDGANALIQGAGTTYIRGSTLILSANGGAGGFETGIRINEVSAETSQVELYYDNSLKLETVSGGIDVTGTAVTDGLTVAGNVSVDGGTIKLDGNYPVGTSNVALGNQALDDGSLSGTDLVAVGTLSLSNNTSGAGNVGIGSLAMIANTTGNYNTAVGSGQDGFVQGALGLNTSGSSNTAIGYQSLRSNTTASDNTAVGYQALYANTDGQYNTAVGSLALDANTSSDYNTAVGYASLGNSTGDSNTAIGYAAMSLNTTGTTNVAVGRQALRSNTTASNNTAVGHLALYSNQTGSHNVAIGTEAAYSSTSTYVTAVGRQAGYNTTTGNICAVGYQAGLSNTTGTANTAVGRYRPLYYNTTGSSNTAIGDQALFNNTTAASNTAVGYQAGYSNTTGHSNTVVGFRAGNSATTGNGSTLIGSYAGYNLTTAAHSNTFVGTGGWATNGAGYDVTTGTRNTIIGGYTGNQGGLDIRTANNYIVLSDGDGNPRVYINGEGKMQVGYPLNTFTSFNCRAHTAYAYAANFQVRTNGYGIYLRNASDTVVGTIIMNASSTNFNTTSDYRLKENVVDLTGAADRVQQLNPSRFNFIEEPDNTVDGFLAHEVANIVPEAVTGEKDAVDDDGNIVAQAIDQSKLVPLLTAALQEALTKIDALEARIAALES